MKQWVRYVIPFCGIIAAAWICDAQYSDTMNMLGGSYMTDFGRLDYRTNARWMLVEISLLDLCNLCFSNLGSDYLLIRYGSIRKAFIGLLSRNIAWCFAWVLLLLVLCNPDGIEEVQGITLYISHGLLCFMSTCLLYALLQSEKSVRIAQILICVLSMIVGWIYPGTLIAKILSWGMVFRSSLWDAVQGYHWGLATGIQFYAALVLMVVSQRLFYLRVERKH